MKVPSFILLLFVCLAYGCIGTDYVDDPVVGQKIIVTSNDTEAIMPGEQVQVEADYYDQYGIKREVGFEWLSSNPLVATVNADGLVTGVADGQTLIQPVFDNFLGPQVQVTVVSDPNAVAVVEISTISDLNLMVGDKVQLSATVKNIDGEVVNGKMVEWFSENSSILTVSASGEVEAVGGGVAGIHAKVDGVKSNSINFNVISVVQIGTFSSAGGYHTVGTARLEVKNGSLILSLSDDFDTDFALGTFIFLANSTNGGMVRSSGFEVGQVFSDGAKSFNISQLNSNIQLGDYKYVVALCKPASITFGFAELK